MTDHTSPQGAALVTGGAKRLGRAFIEALAADGRDVIIHYNSSADEAEALACELRGVNAIALGADLSKPEEALTTVDDRFQNRVSKKIQRKNQTQCSKDSPSVKMQRYNLPHKKTPITKSQNRS